MEALPQEIGWRILAQLSPEEIIRFCNQPASRYWGDLCNSIKHNNLFWCWVLITEFPQLTTFSESNLHKICIQIITNWDTNYPPNLRFIKGGILLAAKSGNIRLGKIFLPYDLDLLNYYIDIYEEGIDVAAQYGNYNIIQLINNEYAELVTESQYDRTMTRAAHQAAKNGRVDTVLKLLPLCPIMCADPICGITWADTTTYFSVLRTAIIQGQLLVVKTLIDQKDNFADDILDGNYLLHYAYQSNNDRLIDYIKTTFNLT